MSDWADTLARFSAVIRTGAVFDGDPISCPNYPASRGVEVYRNNYRGNLHDTLAGAYPVIRQLVGEEFFRVLARRYIKQHPSRSGNLHRYGSELAAFLDNFEDTRHLPYLPDMARLEWAYHCAYFADDAAALDLARLARIAPGDHAELRWILHPACTLLAPAHPVAAIWRAHRDGTTGDLRIDLDGGGEQLLVHRIGLQPEIRDIMPADLHWLSLLQQGTSMGNATGSVLAAHPDFDVASALRHWVAQDVLTDFETA